MSETPTPKGPTPGAPTPEEHAAAYAGIRARLAAVIGSAERDAPCPLTPEWTVGDTLAHAVGVADDVVAGRIEGAATDPWTATQVNARRGRTIVELLAEWGECAPGVEQLMGQLPVEISGQIIFDAVTHEHDLRHAIAAGGAHESDAISIAAGWIAGAAKPRKAEMTPAIEIGYGGRRVVWGGGPVEVSLALSEFEFVRATSGRRSANQVLALGVPDPALVLANVIFSPAAFDVVE